VDVANVLEELSPYCFVGLGLQHTQGWWMWSIVLEILRRYEQTGIPQPELPRSIQRPGALIGLSVGLALRQAALAAEARAA
jgi:hypothetical protein